jgi:hypothetical protein
MRPKHYKSREELSAAVAKEVAELNGEIDRLKMALEIIDTQLKVSGEPETPASDLRVTKNPASISLH